jgi:hypothetical protein
MRVRFWGTRGSLATPEPTALRYGGNTPCVEVRAADGTLLVLDCGTGAYGLGQALVGAGGPPPRGHLLLTRDCQLTAAGGGEKQSRARAAGPPVLTRQLGGP